MKLDRQQAETDGAHYAPQTEQSAHVLVIEEARAWKQAIVATLEKNGLSADAAGSALEAVRLFEAAPPAIVVLDLGLPGRDGIDVWRHLRARSEVPIILLAEGPGISSTVVSIDSGMNGTPSFELQWLASQIKSALGDSLTVQLPDRGVIEIGHIRLDRDRHQVYIHGEEVAFPLKEYLLLDLLLSSAGLPLRHEDLIERVWSERYADDPRTRKTLQVHMKRIRDRIQTDPAHRGIIKNIRGIGYRFQYPERLAQKNEDRAASAAPGSR